MRTSLFFLLILSLITLTACDEALPGTEGTEFAEDRPSLLLDPSAGQVETEINIEGHNFPPDAVIHVYIGDSNAGVIPEALVSTSTDAKGRFTSSLVIPGQWPNGDPIIEQKLTIVAITEDYMSTAVAQFTVQPGGDIASPTLSVAPDKGLPGEIIVVTGIDFIPGTEIALQIGVPQSGLDEYNLAEVTIDEDGQFMVEVQIPAAWPESDVPIIEETLIIGAVDEQIGQTLATDTFDNLSPGVEITAEPEATLPVVDESEVEEATEQAPATEESP